MRKVKSKLSKISEKARRPRKKRGKKTARKKSKRGKSWNKRVATTYKSMKDSNPDTTLGDAIKKTSTGHRHMSGGAGRRNPLRDRKPPPSVEAACPSLGMTERQHLRDMASQAGQESRPRRVIEKTRRVAAEVGQGAAARATRVATDAEKVKNWITTSRDLMRLVGEQKMRQWMNAMMGSGPLVSDEENTARAAAAAMAAAEEQASLYSGSYPGSGMCEDELIDLPPYDGEEDECDDDDTLDLLQDGESNLHRSPSSESIFPQ